MAFIGIDMHKDTHTAAVMDCWTNKIGEITFANRPSAYDKFMVDVKKLYGDLQPIFGLEDTRGFGRNFASYLLGHKYTVKHINPAYTDSMRSSAPMSKKDDSYDAFCVAKILRDMLDTLPDESHDDLFWTIRQFVKRRDSLVQGIIISKNQINAQLTYVYPSYKEYFCDVDTKTAMYFWETYPHPKHLKGLQSEALLAILGKPAQLIKLIANKAVDMVLNFIISHPPSALIKAVFKGIEP